MTIALQLIAAVALSAAPADPHQGHGGHAAPAAAPSAVQGVGVVRAVNAKAGKITIAHEPIPALSWPAMTMAFRVTDRQMLDKVSVGAHVAFDLQGQTITALTVR